MGQVDKPDTDDVRITAEPLDAARCRFDVDRPVYPGRWVYFSDPEGASTSSLASRLFALEGVTAVLVSHDSVTVTRTPPTGLPVVSGAIRTVRRLLGDRSAGSESWPSLGRKVGAALRAHLASGLPAVPEPSPVPVPTEAELRSRVERVLAEDVNPVIAGHGGGVNVLDLKDNVVYLQMWGGCQGCGLADMTLKHGVEGVLREAIPELGAIIDLTDHAAGRKPFVRR